MEAPNTVISPGADIPADLNATKVKPHPADGIKGNNRMAQLHLHDKSGSSSANAIVPASEPDSTAASQPSTATAEMSDTMVEVRKTAEMGLGLFATQDIPRGTRVLSEEPVIHLPDPPYRRDMIRAFCDKAVQLSQDQIKMLSQLHCNMDVLEEGDRDIVQQWYNENSVTDAEGRELKGKKRQESRKKMLKRFAIFITNSSRQISDNMQEGRGVYYTFSRINHACVPNARYGWNDTIKRAPSTSAGTWPRRAEELKGWGFECGCQACQDPASDLRWEQMGIVHLLIESFQHSDNSVPTLLGVEPLSSFSEAMMAVNRLAKLMIEEGLITMELTKMYRTCSNYYWVVNDMDRAIEYAEKALDVELCLIGPETEHLRENRQGNRYWLKWLQENKSVEEDLALDQLRPN
ncbi:uncharacterized protein PG998_011447 [Apiospora kogelbergensis]|uniref:uncharacterized protein n=1 Tax=Apiospora kogelbergensis TaxID=1337665 RepID=UPI00312EAA8D